MPYLRVTRYQADPAAQEELSPLASRGDALAPAGIRGNHAPQRPAHADGPARGTADGRHGAGDLPSRSWRY